MRKGEEGGTSPRRDRIRENQGLWTRGPEASREMARSAQGIPPMPSHTFLAVSLRQGRWVTAGLIC